MVSARPDCQEHVQAALALPLPPKKRIVGTETRLLPSRPLAGRVERRSEAAERGVGGLRLLGIRIGRAKRSFRASGAPHPPSGYGEAGPLPAVALAKAGPRHSLRSRGEGNRKRCAHAVRFAGT